MDNDREFDQVLYNIQRQGGGIMSLLLFSAQMQMKMYVFLGRMAKKALISSGALGKYQTFLAKTEGNYNIYNIPIPEGNTDKVLRLQELEKMAEKEKSPVKAREYRKKIEGLKKEIPELAQLEKLGITHYVLPKLNGGENTLQVAVGKDDIQGFKTWYMNHISDSLSGGKMTLGELKSFTEGNYSIFNMPFEGDEVKTMLHDFGVLGINYAVLPDLNVGDGYTQIAVANKDQAGMDGWFRLWKEGQLAAGLEPGDYQKISEEAYMETSAMDTEDYIAGTDQKYQDANREFSQSPDAVDADMPIPQGPITDSAQDPKYRELDSSPEYQKVTINKETLVDGHEPDGTLRKTSEHYGMFLSRIPGSQNTLILPKDRVFQTDGGKTYIGFLAKNGLTMVGTPDGKISRLPFKDAYAPYDIVKRGMGKVKAISKQEDGPGLNPAKGSVDKAVEPTGIPKTAEKAVLSK